jgi:hypothetical protein
MRIRRVKSRGLVVSRLPASQLRLLQQIPLHADPAGSPPAAERLYQSPVKQPLSDTDDELIQDWQDHVVPDLQDEFSRQLDCVTEDLRQVQRQHPPRAGALHEDEAGEAVEGETYELTIPLDHVDAWYGALNQARLVMQSRYNFPEVENLAAIVALLASENLKPYLTSRFYTEIQAALLDLGMDLD